jgi:uncharacterized paraquat-inducible protein A
MTEPTRIPPPTPIDWTNRSTWCVSCEIHQATAQRPICPVCRDEERKAEEAS